jgi:hypothetical protein
MKFPNKAGSANMWWIIIGAIMALVVMIILMIIFSGGTEKANMGLFDCASKGGACKSPEKCESEGGTESIAFGCPGKEGELVFFFEVFGRHEGEKQVCCFNEGK